MTVNYQKVQQETARCIRNAYSFGRFTALREGIRSRLTPNERVAIRHAAFARYRETHASDAPDYLKKWKRAFPGSWRMVFIDVIRQNMETECARRYPPYGAAYDPESFELGFQRFLQWILDPGTLITFAHRSLPRLLQPFEAFFPPSIFAYHPNGLAQLAELRKTVQGGAEKPAEDLFYAALGDALLDQLVALREMPFTESSPEEIKSLCERHGVAWPIREGNEAAYVRLKEHTSFFPEETHGRRMRIMEHAPAILDALYLLITKE